MSRGILLQSAVLLVGMCVLFSAAPMKVSSSVGWSTWCLLETGDDGMAWLQDVSMNNDGDAVAVWAQSDGIRYDIWANTYTTSGGWGGPELIETNDSVNCSQPRVAVDGEGGAFVVWEQYDYLEHQVLWNRYDAIGGWGTAEVLSADGMYPCVACTDSGNATFVWLQYGGYPGVWSRSYVVGAGLGPSERIDTNSNVPQPPDVDMDDDGNAVAVWSQSDLSSWKIWANTLTAATGWGTAETIDVDSSDDSWQPRVSVNSAGDALVVWDRFEPSVTNASVWGNRFVSGLGWGIAEPVTDNPFVKSWNPRVALSDEGDGYAVWYQIDEVAGETHVMASHYVPDVGWQEGQRIDDASMWAVSCDVTMDGLGNAVAVWTEYDGDYTLCISRNISGIGWTEPLSTAMEGSGYNHPVVAADGLGNAVVVNTQFDGAWDSVYALHYEPCLVQMTSPGELEVDVPAVAVSGIAAPGSNVSVGGVQVYVNDSGAFSWNIMLVEGANLFNVTVSDASGVSETLIVEMTYVDPLSDLEEELAAAYEVICLLLSELNATYSEIASIEAEISSLLDQLNDADDEIESLEGQLSELQTALDGALDELAALGEDLNQSLNWSAFLLDSLEAQEQESEALQDDYEQSLGDLDEAKTSLDDQEATILMLDIVVGVLAACIVILIALMVMQSRRKRTDDEGSSQEDR